MATHILLIEDSHTQALRTRLELERHGLQVHVASTGSGGLRLARTMSFDAILLDLDLPHMSGHHVCRFLKEDRLTQAIPVIVLTHHEDDERRRQSLAVGALAHVAKGQQAIPTILGLLQTSLPTAAASGNPHAPQAHPHTPPAG